MRNYILYIAFIICGISCKKSWLEVTPQGNVVATATEDYDKLMNSPYYYNYYYYYGGWQETIPLGDDVAADETAGFSGGFYPQKDRLFRWEDTVNRQTDDMPTFLSNLLSQRYAYNKVVDEVMDSDGGTEQKKRDLRAQAMVCRAWVHFQLVNYYCKPYVAGTAATDPGFPVITEARINTEKFDRGTLQASYDFIIKNLTDAIIDLPINPVNNVRVSRPAAKALLGKVYLFMGNYNEALPVLQEALNEVTSSGMASLHDYNVQFAPGGSFLPVDPVNGPKSPQFNYTDQKESIWFKVYAGKYYDQGAVLSPYAQALFSANDQRLNLYSNTYEDGSINPTGKLRKFSNWSTFRYTRFGMELPELYLLLAESKARANNLGGAVADVEILRKNRMPAAEATVPAAIAGNQTALVKFIVDERTREFAIDGYRWFDMRRIAVDPLFAGITFTHIAYNTDGTTTTYTLNPNRLTLKLPGKVLEGNPGMPDNP